MATSKKESRRTFYVDVDEHKCAMPLVRDAASAGRDIHRHIEHILTEYAKGL